MSAQEELANAIQTQIKNVILAEDLHYYFGRVKTVKYPFVNIYFPNFHTKTKEQARWEEVDATCVVEYAYASQTNDDQLYDFAEKIRNALLNGFTYTRDVSKIEIKPMEFEVGIVDGFAQVIFDLNYQIDTYVKMDNDNGDKMQSLGLDLTVKEKM